MERWFSFDDGHLKVLASFAWLDDSIIPWRLYIWSRTLASSRSTSHYLRYVRSEDRIRREIIIYNLYLLKELMREYDISVIEALILLELHELTHFSLSGEEERKWRTKSDPERHARKWNGFLLRIIKASLGT